MNILYPNKAKYTINIHNKKKKFFINFTKKSLEKYGFCVIEGVIPKNKTNYICNEVVKAKKKIDNNIQNIINLIRAKKSEKEINLSKKVMLRPQRDLSKPYKPPNDLIFMPTFAKYLASDYIISLAKENLDDHLKIPQLHTKLVPPDTLDSKQIKFNYDLFGLPRVRSGNKFVRDWHSDWPHDTWAYGNNKKGENIGFIKKPFPDTPMCLTMIWYLSSGTKGVGTIVLPGSHRFGYDPRDVKKKTYLYGPLKDEIQIEALAGSVLIQDSRLWHSSPTNFGKYNRVAVVNRWAPWWLSANDYGPKSRLNVVGRPFRKKEFDKLPKKLKPLFSSLCPDVHDYISENKLRQSKLSSDFHKKILTKNKNKFKKISKKNKKTA